MSDESPWGQLLIFSILQPLKKCSVPAETGLSLGTAFSASSLAAELPWGHRGSFCRRCPAASPLSRAHTPSQLHKPTLTNILLRISNCSLWAASGSMLRHWWLSASPTRAFSPSHERRPELQSVTCLPKGEDRQVRWGWRWERTLHPGMCWSLVKGGGWVWEVRKRNITLWLRSHATWHSEQS